jgi:hypothetical protein
MFKGLGLTYARGLRPEETRRFQHPSGIATHEDPRTSAGERKQTVVISMGVRDKDCEKRLIRHRQTRNRGEQIGARVSIERRADIENNAAALRFKLDTRTADLGGPPPDTRSHPSPPTLSLSVNVSVDGVRDPPWRAQILGEKVGGNTLFGFSQEGFIVGLVGRPNPDLDRVGLAMKPGEPANHGDHAV